MVLDFTPDQIQGEYSVGNFGDLFHGEIHNGAPEYLNYDDSNNSIDQNDAKIAARKIAGQVRQILLPYVKQSELDLRVLYTPQVSGTSDPGAGERILGKTQSSDDDNAYVMYVGVGNPANDDLGFAHQAFADENIEFYGYVFADRLADYFNDGKYKWNTGDLRPEDFTAMAAYAIVHELGHLWGIGHVFDSEQLPALKSPDQYHHVMSLPAAANPALVSFPDEAIHAFEIADATGNVGLPIFNAHQEVVDSLQKDASGNFVQQSIPDGQGLTPPRYKDVHASGLEEGEPFAAPPINTDAPDPSQGVLGATTPSDVASTIHAGFNTLAEDYLDDFADQLNLEPGAIPLAANTVADILGLTTTLQSALSTIDVGGATTMALLSSQLQSAGFDITSMIDDSTFASLPTNQPADLIRVTRSYSLAQMTASSQLDASALNAIGEWLGVSFGGSLDWSADAFFNVAFGVDTGGFYLLPGNGLSLSIAAAGEATAALGSLGSVTGTASLSFAADVPLTAAATDGRVRLGDLANSVASTSDLEVTGAASMDLESTIDVGFGSDVNVDGRWIWNLLPDASGFEFAAAVSGFDEESFRQSIAAVVGDAINELGNQANSFAELLGDIPAFGDEIESALADPLASLMSFDFDYASADAYADGREFSVIQSVGLNDLFDYAVDGTPLPSTLFEMRLIDHASIPIDVAAGGPAPLGIGASLFDASLSGQATGEILVSNDITLGFDNVGGIYVGEGSHVSAETDIAAAVDVSAAIVGLAEVSASADAVVSGTFDVILEDGDATAGERLYLTGGDLASIVSQSDDTVSAVVDLNNLNIRGKLSAFGDLLPEISLNASGQMTYDSGTGITTGSLSVDSDALLDAFAQVVVKGVDIAKVQARSISNLAGEIPIIGNDLAQAMTPAVEDLFSIDLPAGETRAYLQNRGFDVVSVLSGEDFFGGQVPTSALLVLRYTGTHTPSSSLALQISDRRVGFDPATISLSGSVNVIPTLRTDIEFGIDSQGPFVSEGGTISASLDSNLALDASIDVGTLLGFDADAAVSIDADVTLTMSDHDTTQDERFYLFQSDGSTGDYTFGDAVSDDRSLDADVIIDASLAVTLDNPAAKIPAIGDLLPQNLLPPTLSFNAQAALDLNLGTSSYIIIDNDQAFNDLMAVFTDPKQAIIDKFVSTIDQHNPLPPVIRDLLFEKVPIIDRSLIDFVDIPDAAKLLLNPQDFLGKNEAELAADDPGNSIDFNLDFLEPTNIVALLTNQPASLISLDVDQSFGPPAQPIPIVAVPFFSFFGVINVVGGLSVVPSIEFEIETVLGIDTGGFYIQEGSAAEPTFSLTGGVGVEIGADVNVVVVPVAELTVTPTLTASGDVYFSDQDANERERFRVNDITNPGNWQLGASMDFLVDVNAKVGLDTRIPAVTLFDRTTRPVEKPLYRSEGVSLQGFVDATDEARQGVQDAVDWMKERAQILACGGALATANPYLGLACTASLLPNLQELGDKAAAWGKEKLGVLEDQLGVIVDDPVGWAEDRIEVGLSELSELDQGFRDFVGQIPGVGNVLDYLGPYLPNASDIGLGDFLSDISHGADCLDGAERTVALSVPDRYSFNATQLADGAIEIIPVNGAALDINIGVHNGMLIIDGPDITRLENVAEEEKASLASGCKWKHDDYIRETVVHRNVRTFDAGSTGLIRVFGSQHDDSILVSEAPIPDGIAGLPATFEVYAGAGDDTIVTGDGFDIVHGGSGQDTIDGRGGDDVLYGYKPVIGLENESDGDQIFGGEGNDEIHGQGGDDELFGGPGQDTVTGGLGNDTLFGGEDDDELAGGFGDDIAIGGSGDDTIDGGENNDFLDGGDGIDTIGGGSGDDTLIGGDQGDTLYGGAGNDELFGDDRNGNGSGGGVDHLEGGTGHDFLRGGPLNDELYGGDGADVLIGDSGNDLLIGYGLPGEPTTDDANDFLDGGQGNDTLRGGPSGPSMAIHPSLPSGSPRQDILRGGDDRDLLEGGDGPDILDGGEGDDAPLNGGDGGLFGGDGDDEVYGHTGDDFIEGGPGADTLLGGADSDEIYGHNKLGLNDDGAADLISGGLHDDELFGQAGNDTINGLGGADLIEGGLGDDKLYGYLSSNITGQSIPVPDDASMDTIHGGDGDDELFGEGGDDILFAGDGNDTLGGGTGDDELHGEDGDDHASGNEGEDIIHGGDGDDSLDGGADDDSIFAGAGHDSVDAGDGDDLVEGGTGNDTINGGDGIDRIFGEEDDDQITGGAGGDFLEGGSGHDNIDGGTGDDQIDGQLGNDVIAGGDGDDIITGGDGDDIIAGDAGIDTIEGNLGDDQLSGGDGDDQIFGHDGMDTIDGDAGNDTLIGGLHDDNLSGGPGMDVIEGNEGNDNISGGDDEDVIHGHAGDDVVDGGGGNDVVVGNIGNDTLRGGPGDDLLDADAGDDFVWGGTDNDTIYGDEGNDQLEGDGGNDLIIGANGDDVIRGGAGHDVIEGNDGMDSIEGGLGNDRLFGGKRNDVIDGGDGDDFIQGDRGNDTLRGGDGDDHVFGGAGQDQITGEDGNDHLDGGADVDHIDGGSGDDFLTAGNGIGDQLIGGAGNDTILGSDSGAATDNDFNDDQFFGDQISGGSGNDIIRARGGADRIDAGEGDDEVDAGDGADLVLGGEGDDWISLSLGFGDVAFGDGGNDVIIGSFLGNDLIYGGDGHDQIQSQGGTDTVFGEEGDDFIDAGMNADVIRGGPGNDELLGGGGAGDQLFGDDGDDLLSGSDDGADIIDGGAGRDRLLGNAGNDVLLGGPDDDVILGGPGDDQIEGGPGVDTLIGQADHDTLYGHTSAAIDDDQAVDYLYGDFGYGSVGQTTITISGNPGRDRLFGGGGNDLHFGEAEDDFIDPGTGASDWVDYGTGETATPSDFTTPVPTANPVLVSVAPLFAVPVVPPTGVTGGGRFAGIDGSKLQAGLSGGTSSAIDPAAITDGGTRYAFWADDRTGQFQIYGLRHTDSNGWSPVGDSTAEGGISRAAGSSQKPSVAIDSAGQPVVAWVQSNGDSSDVIVKRFNESLSTWEILGSDAPDGASDVGSVDDAKLVRVGDDLVLVWRDRLTGFWDLQARKFDEVTQTWTSFDGSGNGLGINSSADVLSFAVDSDGANLFVAVRRDLVSGDPIAIRQHDGSDWSDLSSMGGRNVSADNFPSGNLDIASHDGELFLAWQDAVAEDEFGHEIMVSRLSEGIWVDAGMGSRSGRGVSGDNASSRIAADPQLQSDGNVLALTWFDRSSADVVGSHRILHFNGTRFNETIDGDASGAGIAGGLYGLTSSSIALDDQSQAWFVSESAVESMSSSIDVGVAQVEPVTNEFVANESRSVAHILATETLVPGDRIQVRADQSSGFTLTSAHNGIQIHGSPGVSISGPVIIDSASSINVANLDFASGLTIDNASLATIRDAQASSLTINGGSTVTLLRNVVGDRVVVDGTTTGLMVVENQLLYGLAFLGSATDVQVADNRIVGVLEIASATSGSIFENEINGTLDIQAEFTGDIDSNRIHGTDIGVQYDAPATLTNNIIEANETGVVVGVTDPELGFGVFGIQPNNIRDNNTGVQLSDTGSLVAGQIIEANAIGVAGAGAVGGSNPDQLNIVSNNALGIDVEGDVRFSLLESNDVGVQAKDRQLISNNAFDGNNVSVSIASVTQTRVMENRFQDTQGVHIDLSENASEVGLRGNLLQTSGGINVRVASGSQHGLVADYNVLHAEAGGNLYQYRGITFDDLLVWQQDIGQFDQNSFGSTVIAPLGVESQFTSLAPVLDQRLESVAAARRTNPATDGGDPLQKPDTPIAENLLTNGDFSEGLSEWNSPTSLGASTISAGYFDGSDSVQIATQGAGALSQRINLIAAGHSATEIDSGQQDLIASVRLRMPNGSQNVSTLRLEIAFQSDSGDEIETVSRESVFDSSIWHLVGDRLAIPSGTRWVDFRIVSDGAGISGQREWVDDTFVAVVPDHYSNDIGYRGSLFANVQQDVAPRLHLRGPDLYIDWERDTPKVIRWDTFDVPRNEPVRIDLLQDTPDGPALLTTITATTDNDGEFSWTPAISSIDYGTHGLSLQLSLANDPIVFDRSLESFSVPEDTTEYFVNDDSQVGDEYTSAIGDHRNTGRLASAPKPSLGSVIDTYAVSAGDVVTIDTGDFASYRPMVIANQPGVGDDEGFTLRGAQTGTTSLRQVFSDTSAPVLELVDADVMVVSDLTFEGGTYGIYADEASEDGQFSRLTVTANTLDGVHLAGTENQFLTEVEATGNGRNGVWIQGDIGEVSSVIASGNGGDGVRIIGAVTEVTNSLLHDNGGRGLSLNRPGSGVIQANEIYRNAQDGIQVSVGHGLLIGAFDLNESLGNWVFENGRSGISVGGYARVQGNTVFGHPSYPGIASGGVITQNVVYRNRIGISGETVGNNRIYENSIGISLGSLNAEATGNVVYSSTTGIATGHGSSVTNNLVYDTNGYAITGGTSTIVRNNTLAPATSNPAVSVGNSSQVTNNIFAVTDAPAFGTAGASPQMSDFNLFDLSGDATIGSWEGTIQDTLADWNKISGHDENSIVADALFVDPAGADGAIGASGTSKGFDDDFHLQSPYGSFHGGTFAPILDDATGLPVLLTATLTNDTELSPGIDRGDLAVSVGDEPANNGGVINVGAFGGTHLASKSPEEYLIVTQPNSPATLPIGQTFDIQWRTSQSGGTVDIEFVPVAGGDATLIADDISNNGMLSYQVDAAVPLGEYIIRVSASDSPVGNSVGIVTIAAETTNFYVNLAVDADLTDNQYTTAAGNENADGLTPATPSDSIQRILDSYDLGPGDTILVDTGEYLIDSDITIVAQDSGITIAGPTEESKTAVINRGGSGTAFYLNGIGNAILTELAITNAHKGVRIVGSQFGGTTGIQISSSEIYGHITGIEVASSVSGTTIENNVIRNNALYGIYHDAGGETTIRGNEIFSNAHGMNMRCRASHLELMIEQNTIRSNYNWGLTACGSETIVQNNTIYGHQRTVHPEGFGLEISEGIAQDNEIYDNRMGITGRGDVLRNHVHDNFTGVDLRRGTFSGNVVQGNTHGVLAQDATIQSNLFYDNQDNAVSTEGVNQLIGNTIVHSDTVAVSFAANSSTQVRNNIISVDSATAISIDATSQLTFESDYNLFEINGTGKLAQWGEQSFDDLSAWSQIYGLDNNSQIGDPGFTDPGQNDFHLQSGSLGIDRGDPTSPFANEPTPNGSRVNLGVYGNTPEATRSLSQTLQVLSPIGTQRWEAGLTQQVRFRSDGLPADAVASIDVSVDAGQSWTEIATDVELDSEGSGQFDWLVPASFATETASAMIRVRSNNIDDISTAFMIAPAGNEYFINIADDSDLTDNQYTSAAGDNRNSGKRSDAPMTSFGALMNAYEIVAGDIIYVDTGTYSIGDDIRLTAANSGVTITGPTDVNKTVVLNRGNRNSGADLFELRGVSDVTISHLTIQGGHHGIALVQNTGNTNITIRDNTLVGNTWGIRAFSGNSEIDIYGNEVRNNSNGISVQATPARVENNRVFANGYGIAASDLPGESGVTTQTIIGNEVFSNSTYGVHVEGYGTLVSENVVYGNRQSGVYVGSGARVVNNEVYENVTGFHLFSDSIIDNNQIHGNAFGIWSSNTEGYGSGLSAEITRNSIFGNRYGIYLAKRDFHHPIIESNLIYDNSTRAIEIEDWRGDRGPIGKINGNTIHHIGSSAIGIANAIDLSIINNVISVQDGSVYDVSVTDPTNFESDYNLYDFRGSTSFAQWSGANVASLFDWKANFDFDFSSFQSDPLYVDIDGADDQLGFTAIPVQIVDNGDPGFEREGEWSLETGEGFDGDYLIGQDGGSNVARWTFDDLTPGKLYRLAVNFVPYALVSAIYDVSDNSGLLGRVSYWQQDLGTESAYNSTMRHLDADGFTWTRLGAYRPSGTSLSVSMRAGYFSGYRWAATADAMRIDEVVADSINDDDFHLQPASPGIDRAHPADDFALEPTPNGGRRNLGAYGNTSEATRSNAQTIRVNAPFGGEKWIAGLNYPIEFDSQGLTETVSLDVSIDAGETWTEIATDVAIDASGLGSFDWTIPETFVTPENTARIRARSGGGLGVSPGSFQITPPRVGTETPFYINIAGDTDFSDNQYTTAAGDNRNSGRSPDRPMASLAALLGAYDLEPGDVIYVDSGTYSLMSNVRIYSDDSGVTITGPTGIDLSAVINRADNTDGTAVFELVGATDVTISHLGIRGAHVGIRIPSGTGSSGIVIEDNDIFAHRHAGIEAGPGNPNITVRRNEIHDNSTHGVVANAEDMLVESNRILSNRYGVRADNLVEVRDNDVIANTDFGIYVLDDRAIAARNRVWGHDIGSNAQWEGGVGIYIDSSGTAIDNVVYDNGTGIAGEDSALIQSNRIFGNQTGVRSPYGFGVQIVGNTVYSNSRGILVANSAEILTNLIYANTNSAVSLEGFSCTVGSCLVAGNTIHHATGDAVSIGKSTFGPDSYNARIYNNVISVDNGAAIAVQTGSADGFRSDNNLIQLGAGNAAVYGEYEGAVATDLAAWQAETGQSSNSIEADPLFIDPNGIDNLLGYVDGVDYGRDDNWALAKGSPAIDAGNTLATTPSDYLGSARRDDPGTLDSGSADHLESSIQATNYTATGVSLGLSSSGFTRTQYTLPFSFPLFGANLTDVEISNQGLLQFHNSSWMPWSSDAETRLKSESRYRVTALWQDIHTAGPGDGVFVDDSIADQVTFHWNATSSADAADVRFGVTLHSSGNFDFHYGTTGGLPAVAGYVRPSWLLMARTAASNGMSTELDDTTIRFEVGPGFTDIGALEFRGDSDDVMPPFIASASPAAISVGGTTNDTIDSFEVIFNEEVNFFDASSFAAYDLREAGLNGTFGDGDDTVYEITPEFNLGDSSVNLLLDPNVLRSIPIGNPTLPGPPVAAFESDGNLEYYLPEGNYRFELKSDPTGGIRDTAGLSIDGDGDNAPGGSFVQDFQVLFTPEYLSLNVTPSILEGETATLTGSFRDLSDGVSYTLLVDWGDGTAVQSFPIPDGETSFSLTHLYVNDSLAEVGGQFQVTTTLANDLGRQTLNVDRPLAVTVDNLAPTIDSLQVPAAVNEGETFSISGTFTELGTDDELVLSVDWGHGPVEDFPLPTGSSNFVIEHTYTNIASRVAPIDQVISVTLSDGSAASDAMVNNVQLTTLNAPPQITDETFEVTEHPADETIVGQVVNSDPDLTAPNQDTQTFEIVGGSGFGIYEIDPSGVIRVTNGEAIDYETTASHSLFVEVTDGRGATDLALVTVDLQNVTEIESIIIDDGSNQRSMVRSIVVNFDASVTLDSGAIEIETDSGEMLVPMVETRLDQGRTIATLTFSGDDVDAAGSLADGNYRLRIDRQKVTPTSAAAMRDDHVDSFFRFFGDTDGDRDVDGQDYGRFGLTFLKSIGDPGFDERLDSDGDGDVDGQDYGRFGLRFLRSLPS